MALKKLKKGTLKRAWTEAKQKGIAKAQRAKGAMKRAWQLTGSTKSPGRSSTRATSTNTRSGGSTVSNGRKLRLNVSVTDGLCAASILGPAVPAVQSVLYYASKGMDNLARNAPGIIDNLVKSYAQSDKMQLIGVPVALQIGKRIVGRIFGVKKLTGIAMDGNYVNVNL